MSKRTRMTYNVFIRFTSHNYTYYTYGISYNFMLQLGIISVHLNAAH